MASIVPFPRFYPILDGGALRTRGVGVEEFASGLYRVGVRFLQYRDKEGGDEVVLQNAAVLRRIFVTPGSILILNDRVELVGKTGFDGVHLGQEDRTASEARRLLGPQTLIGLSTHDPVQLLEAARGDADYLAIGPVFQTTTKRNPDPALGISDLTAAVRSVRSSTTKPIVAIGGIRLENLSDVFRAGVDSAAVISDLLPGTGGRTEAIARKYLRASAEIEAKPRIMERS